MSHSTEKNIDEKELIRQLQEENGRREAFARMVELYNQQLYWRIRRMVCFHEDADDILQNTFVKAWCNISNFRGESKLSTWLYRIAINETLTFLQKQRETSDTEHVGLSLADKLRADEYFDGDETVLQLQQAIAQLPEKQRIVFNMRYYEEMKYEEMSRILQTSVGALKASYHHAVKKIQLFFEQRN